MGQLQPKFINPNQKTLLFTKIKIKKIKVLEFLKINMNVQEYDE